MTICIAINVVAKALLYHCPVLPASRLLDDRDGSDESDDEGGGGGAEEVKNVEMEFDVKNYIQR